MFEQRCYGNIAEEDLVLPFKTDFLLLLLVSDVNKNA